MVGLGAIKKVMNGSPIGSARGFLAAVATDRIATLIILPFGILSNRDPIEVEGVWRNQRGFELKEVVDERGHCTDD